jgi:hypothetical protein
MKVKMKKYEFGGFFAISAISLVLLLIFLFTSVDNAIYRWFFPINNSLWETGKLMFTAILLYSIVELFIFGHKYSNFIFSKSATLFIAPLIYIFGSYLIDSIIGVVYTNTHIVLFLISIGIGQYLSYYFMEREYYFKLMNAYGVIAIVIMLVTFLAYSHYKVNFNSPIFNPMNIYEKNI